MAPRAASPRRCRHSAGALPPMPARPSPSRGAARPSLEPTHVDARCPDESHTRDHLVDATAVEVGHGETRNATGGELPLEPRMLLVVVSERDDAQDIRIAGRAGGRVDHF